MIGRGKKQLSCRPITAGYIIFVSFSFRFRFVFVSFSSQTFRHFVIPGRSRPRNGRKDPTLGNPNSPNSLFRSVGVLYVSVVSPEYSVFSGLTTETLLLEDRSVGRVDLFRIPPFRRLDFAGPSGGDHQIIAVRDVVTRLPTCPARRRLGNIFDAPLHQKDIGKANVVQQPAWIPPCQLIPNRSATCSPPLPLNS